MKIKLHPLHWTARLTVGYALSLALGVFLYFCFQRWPTILTEFISPVNGSVWECVKTVFWPLLVLLPLAYGRDRRSERLLGVLTASLALLLLGWGYHTALQCDLLTADLLIFALSLALGWSVPGVVELPKGAGTVLRGLTVLFVTLLLAFTLVPPDGRLFQDAALTDVWVRLTC